MICLPMARISYEQLKQQETIESNLTADKIGDIIALKEGVFFFYSFFAASASIVSLNHLTNSYCLAQTQTCGPAVPFLPVRPVFGGGLPACHAKSMHYVTAVNIEELARDEARFIGGQENTGADQILGLLVPFQRG